MSTDHPPASEIRMADDIVRQLGHLSPEQRAERLVQHIRSFWEPRMHARLLAQVSAAGEDCSPDVARAAQLLAD